MPGERHEVYGSLGETGYFYEHTPYRPRSPYSASKAAAALLVKAYFHTYGLPVTLSNCSNNYGVLVSRVSPSGMSALPGSQETPVYICHVLRPRSDFHARPLMRFSPATAATVTMAPAI